MGILSVNPAVQYNFSIDIDLLTLGDFNNFRISNKNVYFKGICLRHLSNINEIK